MSKPSARQHFTVIGMTDEREVWFPPQIRDVIAKGRVFSGGKRHHEIVASLLPEGACWIDITAPLEAVFEQYAGHPDVVVFASGDPLFFGFANTLRRELPEAEITVYPSFNSLQMLAHRMQLPYADMRTVSLTGRPWDGFDEAVIRGERLIGALTDRHKTPAMIARRLRDYGYDNYRMTVGECLGNQASERVRTFASLDEAAAADCAFPNCLILERTALRPHPFGLPERDFALLDGRVNMITKMPIRLLTLSRLDLAQRTSFWDVGFCTGSVSIEARLQFPQLKVTSFEIREAGRELMEKNARKFGAPGIHAISMSAPFTAAAFPRCSVASTASCSPVASSFSMPSAKKASNSSAKASPPSAVASPAKCASPSTSSTPSPSSVPNDPYRHHPCL